MTEAVELFSRRGCHLCERLLEHLVPTAVRLQLTLSEFDVDEDRELRARFGDLVPVLRYRGRVLGQGADAPALVCARLEAAATSDRGPLTIP